MSHGNVKLREMNESDVEYTYLLRNSPEIRKWMFNGKEIDHDEHIRYWKKRLGDGHCYIIIHIDQRVGLVKLDKGERGYEVDIYLDPRAQGKGIGTVALNLLLQKAAEQDITEIFARIKEGNGVSKKIFEKNGFKEDNGYMKCNLVRR
jgi:RimJ/RimL family protein N-acetyltransferase